MQILENVLFTLVNTRIISPENVGSSRFAERPLWDRDYWRWGPGPREEYASMKSGLARLKKPEWYVPGEEELAAAQSLVDRYLTGPFDVRHFFGFETLGAST